MNPKTNDPRLPAFGSRLTAIYKGSSVVCTVHQGGFEYRGTTYPTLTAVAKVVTGHKEISGFRFFGLDPRKSTRLFKPKDRVLVKTPTGPTYGVISWYQRGGYEVLTTSGLVVAPKGSLTPAPAPRSEAVTLDDVRACYRSIPADLTPHPDGPSVVERRSIQVSLHRLMAYLFGDLGRSVPQEEALSLAVRGSFPPLTE